MSALAGCCWLDSRPASVDDLRASTAAARHRARQPFRFRCAGPVSLAYAADSPDSCQPFHDPLTNTTVIVDGCIDNVDELLTTLGLARTGVPAVVLAAWQRWGRDAGARIFGDFVIVISDESARRVVCIRDPMGQRPLFYGAGPRAVVFGSEMQQVVRHREIPVAPNEAMIAEYLTDDPVTVGETLWRNVYRLPPAHVLEIAATGATTRRYWDFNPDARIEHARDGDYQEQFAHLLKEAVACRVDGVEGVGVFLSGGIDSSSIAGVAQTMLVEANRPALRAFSLAFPGKPCDETAFSRAVVDKWRLPSVWIDAEAPVRERVVNLSRRGLDVPPHPNSLMVDPLRERAAAAGVRMLLTGFGGDDFFTGSPGSRFALLREGRPIAWVRAMIGSALPERVRAHLRPAFGARPGMRPWIRPNFAARTALADRLRSRPELSFPTAEQQEIHRCATSLIQLLGDEMEDRAAHAAGIVQRHPFYDRRVAEFGLALPASQRSDGRDIKLVVRRALHDYLPSSVAARTTLNDKAEFSSSYVEALEAIGGRDIFRRLRSEESGWVDGRVISDMYEHMIQLYSQGSGAYIASAGSLWSVAALEIWLGAGSTGIANTPSAAAY